MKADSKQVAPINPLPIRQGEPNPSTLAKLAKAKVIYRQILTWETSLFATRDQILRGAWQLGVVLSDLKEEVGHGNWMLWLTENFKELGRTERMVIDNAERCLKFHKLNSNSGNSRNFTDESVRKFMWGYIPAKDRPTLKGDSKDAPGMHYLTFINNFAKWDRQVQIGQATMPPADVLRHELENTVRRIIELCGPDWINRLLTS